MQKALDDFEECIRRVHALHALYISFAARLTAAVDLSDILRAEVVLAVSALDYFIHELTRIGMLESWVGTRAQTDALQRYQLPLSIAKQLSNVGTAQQVLDAEIRTKHSFLSFQHPDKVADAIRLFSEVRLWDEVGREIGLPAQIVKSSLSLIVDRRNKIAHEADIDPSYPGQRWPIDVPMVEEIFDKIEAICRAIFKVST
jgi:hypothetical protein